MSVTGTEASTTSNAKSAQNSSPCPTIKLEMKIIVASGGTSRTQECFVQGVVPEIGGGVSILSKAIARRPFGPSTRKHSAARPVTSTVRIAAEKRTRFPTYASGLKV